MKKIILPLSVWSLFLFSGCAELQQAANQYGLPTGTLSNAEIASGLKEALGNGISKQVSKLTVTDGFYKNQLVKILLPPELQKVDKTLRDIGLSSLADEGLKVLNRAAEDAVKTATPVFVDAVRNMTFADAKNILLGDDHSATAYLQNTTSTQLYTKFNPVVAQSLGRVGADKVWANIITKYNALPLTQHVNPDLDDYVTRKAMDGVFTMIGIEEKDIRNNLQARTSDLLRRVFAIQDGTR
jgi:hypothetical protein